MVIALQIEILGSVELGYDYRLHGVLMVAKGRRCYVVRKSLNHRPSIAESWVRQFNDRGSLTLLGQPIVGSTSRISYDFMDRIDIDLIVPRPDNLRQHQH